MYTIWVVGNQVKDAAGNAVAGQKVGAFTAQVSKATQHAADVAASPSVHHAKRKHVKDSVLD